MSNSDDDCPTDAEAMVPTALTGINWLFIMSMCCRFWWNFNSSAKPNNNSGLPVKQKAIKDGKLIKIMGGVAMVFYVIGVGVIFSSSMIDLANENQCRDAMNISVTGWLFDFLAYCLILALFSARLIKTFSSKGNNNNDISNYVISDRNVRIIQIICAVPFFYTFFMFAMIEADVITPRGVAPLIMIYVLFIVCVSGVLLKLFISKLNLIINDFIKQFGKISEPQLHQLNRSIRYLSVLIHVFVFWKWCWFDIVEVDIPLTGER